MTKRRDAVLRLLRSDFDIDGTVAWVVREYAEEPTMERAKNKEKLARNLVTIGSSGDQQALNMVAFQQALALHAEDQRRKAVNVHEATTDAMKVELDRARSQIDDLEKDYRDQVNKVQNLQERLSEAEKSALRQALPEPEPAAA